MTTLMVVDGNRGEGRSKAVARRLRTELADRQISVAEVARRLETTQQKLSRRMAGHVAWDVDELDEVCRAAGISFDYVTTGIRAIPGPDGDGLLRPDIAATRPTTLPTNGFEAIALVSPFRRFADAA